MVEKKRQRDQALKSCSRRKKATKVRFMKKIEVLEVSSAEKDSVGPKNPTCKYEGNEDEVEESPLRSIFCLKRNINMEDIEEKEDCFILDFDPSDSIDIAKLSVINDGGDDEIAVVAEKGQVACRDYAHSRHLCLQFPFDKTSHEKHCQLCYCYVCDKAAPCEKWELHCHAAEHIGDWKFQRNVRKLQAQPRKS
ncbi:hypothetical protein CCACVL1_05569 [Corchorus capsularis]|uniref:Uncharacterized protein n=1 Tax=Corchorus capsularis TaxID=210143 RepID=A0A1R3JJZ6_COCAP|nr:hypothetical protein CCACVL1_05569 [Corchorus capsularis]